MLEQNFVGVEVDYVKSYMQMHSGDGMTFRDDDNGISYTAFGPGSTVFVVDNGCAIKRRAHRTNALQKFAGRSSFW